MRTILNARPLRSSPCSSHSRGCSSVWRSSNCLWEITTTQPCLLLRVELLLLFCWVRLRLTGPFSFASEMLDHCHALTQVTCSLTYLNNNLPIGASTGKNSRSYCHEENFNNANLHDASAWNFVWEGNNHEITECCGQQNAHSKMTLGLLRLRSPQCAAPVVILVVVRINCQHKHYVGYCEILGHLPHQSWIPVTPP